MSTSTTTITYAQLRSLRPGALLTVRLRSGREIKARLHAFPKQVFRGKPGLNRIELEVVDVEAAARLSDRASIFTALDTRHTVSGDRVVSLG